MFPALGQAGLLSLPYPEEFGGGDQPYEVYLQVLEEIASRWAAVAVAVSVHSLSCFPLFTFGTATNRRNAGYRTCWAATPSARTAFPKRRPDPTPPRCRARRRPPTVATASTVRKPGSPTAARRTSTTSSHAPVTTVHAASPASWWTRTPKASASENPKRRWGYARSPLPPRTTTTPSFLRSD